jgi:pimeloyl-ACP methyl ester carboxylesterase
MVRWALTVAPPIIFEQYAKPFRRRWRFKKRKGVRRLLNLPIFVVRLPVELTRLVATAIMSAVAVLVLLLLLLLGILPIPKASGIVARLGSKLAGSLGDSYVLLESPAQFDAMITRVSRDLEWLAARCHKVVVVAHSQGAVIAHRALRRHRPRNVELFITLGAGLSKLVHIGTVRGRPKELRSFLVGASWMSTGLLLFFTVLGLLRLVLTGSVRELADVLLLVFGINSVYILLLPLIAGFTSRESVEHDLRQQLKLSGLTPGAAGFRWLDVHATADPVPNGPIFETGCQWIEDHEVRNWSSALNDHSGYVRNPDGFLGPLALRLGRLADDIVGQRLSGAYQEQILSASRRRRRRVGMLVAARWALLVAGIFATVRFWHDLRARANDVIVATPSWIKDPIKKLATSIQDFLEESRLEGPLRRMGLHLESTDEVVVAACLAIAAGLLAYTLVYLTWNAWEQRDVRRFIRGEPFDLGGFRSTTFVVTTLLVFVPAMVAGFAGTWDHPKDRSSVMDVVGRVGDILARLPLTSLMFVSFILLMIAFVGYVRMYDKGRFEEASRVVLWGFFVWLTSIVFVTPLGLLMPSWWDFPWLFISIPVTILSAVAVVRVLRRQGEAIREWLIQRSIQ